MKKIATILFVLLAAQISFAQAFIAAVSQVPMNTEAIVERTDGSEVTGKIKSATLIMGVLKSFTLKDADGNKIKFKSGDVKSIKVKPGLLGKLDMIAEKTSSIKEMAETDFNEIIDREWVYFERVISPKKNKKPLLLQRLNPGFDAAIQIYNNPGGGKTGTLSSGDVDIIGGEDRSYIAVKSNGDTFYIRKASYDKNIRENLGDCEAFIKHFESQKLKFSDIARHVYYYNELCQ